MVEANRQDKVEDLTVFCPERWVSQTVVLCTEPHRLDVDTWVAFLYETTNLFKKMGSAMSMAFSGMNNFPIFIQLSSLGFSYSYLLACYRHHIKS